MLKPPVGGHRQYGPLLALIIGATGGGLLLGSGGAVATVLLMRLPHLRMALVAALIGMVLLAAALPSSARWLPERRCQVARVLLRQTSLNQTALRWGFQLGLGFRTYLVTPAFYALIGIMVGQSNPVAALAIGGSYGLVRGAAISGMAVAQCLRGLTPEAVGEGLERRLRPALLLCAVIAAVPILAT